MEYLNHIKCYSGYIMAVGAGCCFGVNNWIALILLMGASYSAYKCSGKC